MSLSLNTSMYIDLNKSGKHYTAPPISAGVILLLLLYVSAYLCSPAILHHNEHDHVVHQQDTCEKDPCHISMFHSGESGGCNHKFHFTEDHEKCPWCDVTLARQQSTPEPTFLSAIFSQSTSVGKIVVIAAHKISVSHADRGPPVYTVA